MESDGYRFAQPILVWGFGSQEVGIAATPFSVSFLVRPRVFLRPDHDFAERRAQPSSRLAGTPLTQRRRRFQATP
jgi:hypothetical protein